MSEENTESQSEDLQALSRALVLQGMGGGPEVLTGYQLLAHGWPVTLMGHLDKMVRCAPLYKRGN